MNKQLSNNLICVAGADPFGFPTLHRPWNEGTSEMEMAKKRLSAAFEFFTKLGVRYCVLGSLEHVLEHKSDMDV